MILRILGAIVLAAALGAALDLGIIACGAFGVMFIPDSLLVDLATVLAYFTYLPSITTAALTLLIGAFIVLGHRPARRFGKLLVIVGIVSAVFTGLIYVPAPLPAPRASSPHGCCQTLAAD